jgi:flavorubredoxin
MTARIDEIAEDIFRISTHRPDGLPGGLVYNQFLIRAGQPMLVHTGMPVLFPGVAGAIRSLIAIGTLRWIAGSHASRPDEFGALSQFQAVAPRARVVAGRVAVGVCLRHMTEHEPRALGSGADLDLGDRAVRFFATPHVPFWEAGMWWDERTGTLLCGDLFTAEGDGPALTGRDIVGPAVAFESRMRHLTLSRSLAPTLRTLAGLEPRGLALMHGPAFTGDGAGALRELAAHYDSVLSSPAESAGAA